MNTDNLPVNIYVVGRGIVFNSKNQLLIVSDSSMRWHIPGGTLEDDIDLSELTKKEIYEETGLLVKIENIAFITQISRTVEDGYFQNKFINHKHIIRTCAIYYHCKIDGKESIDLNWKDIGHGVIKHRKFVDENEFISMENFMLKKLQKMTFKEIQSLKSFQI